MHAFAVALVLSVATGCGSGQRTPRSEGSHQVARPASLGRRELVTLATRCTANPVAIGSNRTAYAALVVHATAARKLPGRAGVVARLRQLDVNGVPTVLGVLAVKVTRSCAPGWYRVQLSIVPNGTIAWVPARSVRIFKVTSRIVVSLSKRRLDVYRSGRRAFRARVAIGAPATRTPTGRFFVNERFLLSDPNGPFGVAALGISAHSTTLQDWAQGGPIALHGTNDPASIGGAVSHGCVRLANDDMRRLLALAPTGTPVLIKA